MAEYIERVKLIEKIANTPFGLNCTGESDDYKEGVLRGLVAKQNNVIDMIKDQPAADVAPVVHGKWVSNGIPDSVLVKCSECGIVYGSIGFNYCPNCGAKMDLEDE